MDPENLALAKEEATLTKIRNLLNTLKVGIYTRDDSLYHLAHPPPPGEAVGGALL